MWKYSIVLIVLLHSAQFSVSAPWDNANECENNYTTLETLLKDKDTKLKLIEELLVETNIRMNYQLRQMKEDSALVKDQKDQIAKLKQQHEYLPHNCPNEATNGIHFIKVLGINEPFLADCDSAINGPGWMVIQRRMLNANNVSFNRTWAEYRTGFGENQGNYFIGMEKLHLMTQAQSYDLYIHLQSVEGETRYALYDNFIVGNENESYKLKSVGKYTGNAGDSLSLEVGSKFATIDHMNPQGCTKRFGPWWYTGESICQTSNLNADSIDSIVWRSWSSVNFRLVQMMIRPRND